MREVRRSFLIEVLVVLITASLCAQVARQTGQAGQAGTADAPLGGDPLKQIAEELSQPLTGTFDASTGILKLDVVVTDKSGKPVTGLDGKDFTLRDNGQPQKIVTFQAFDGVAVKPDPPVEVILVIDAFNISSADASRTQQEVVKFLRENEGRLAQPVSIDLLSSGGFSVMAQPSTDGNVLAEKIAQAFQSLSIGPVDSLGVRPESIASNRNQLSLNALGAMVLEARQRPGRKLMIWLGYGWPARFSGVNSFDWITEFSTRMREARIELSAVNEGSDPVPASIYREFLPAVKSERQALPGNLMLQVLALQSGGRVINVKNDVAGQIDDLAKSGNAYYSISFDPPRTDEVDEYHDLKVQVTRPGLEVRTNSGYYDQPSFYDQPPRTDRVTVEQLERILGAAQGSSDSQLAATLSGLELTERMSSAKLADWKDRTPGTKSRAELVAVADASAFRNPPADKVPETAAPDIATQRLMISKTIEYLMKTIPRLPNFFATRSTVRYRESGQKDDAMWKAPTGDELLHSEAVANATVLYRNGFDMVDAEAVKGRKAKKAERKMDTKGTFGPILSTVIGDAAHGNLRWNRWEKVAGGLRAVFEYSVPQAQSHFGLDYCCLTDGDGTRVFKFKPGYHGELTIDADSGAILRLTVVADLEPRSPLQVSDIMVQYGPETIGGSTYICPVRSVSLWRGRRNVRVNEWGSSFKVYGPFETMLDDVSFEDYHLFRGEARILPGTMMRRMGSRGIPARRLAQHRSSSADCRLQSACAHGKRMKSGKVSLPYSHRPSSARKLDGDVVPGEALRWPWAILNFSFQEENQCLIDLKAEWSGPWLAGEKILDPWNVPAKSSLVSLDQWQFR